MTLPSITKAGRLKILYSMIFNKSSSLIRVASQPSSEIACFVVSYNALQLEHPVPNTFHFLFNYKVNIPIVIRRTTNIILKKRCCYPQHDVPVHLQSPKNAANNLRASSQFSRLIQYRTFGVSISP